MKLIQKKPILLASSSPRRRNFLENYALKFRIVTPEIEERPLPAELPLEFARRLAREKAEAVLPEAKSGEVILAADTIVVLEGRIFGKPESPEEAIQMLSTLRGQTHEVVTAYCLLEVGSGKTLLEDATSLVTFKPVSPEWIAWYAQTGDPLDKAGAYSLQGLGAFLVQSVAGSFSSVIGLPIEMVLEDLVKEGWIEWAP